MAEYYQIIYLLVITFFSIAVFPKYKYLSSNGIYRKSGKDYRSAKWLCLFLIFFIGTRPAHACFVDMMYYYKILEERICTTPLFNLDAENRIFDNILNLWAYYGLSSVLFFILIAFVYFGGILYTCHKLFPGRELLAFLVYVAAFSSFSYSVNGIKAGAAASSFLVALAYYDKYYVAIPLMLLSWGFHHSMVMPILAYVCVIFVKNPKFYFWFWLFCLIMCLGHVTFFQFLFANYADEKGADYLLSTGKDWGGTAGLRLDFILYSLMPVVVGFISIYVFKVKDRMLNIFLGVYLICNGIWMLCMYVNYNNRIAYLSWFMYPIILLLGSINPIWRKAGYLSVAMVATLHLAFTLFMMLIYY